MYICTLVEVTTIINSLKLLQLCKNLLFQLKQKLLAMMLFRLILSRYSLDGLGNYSERVSSLGLIVIVDSIKEENDFVELKTQANEK